MADGKLAKSASILGHVYVIASNQNVKMQFLIRA